MGVPNPRPRLSAQQKEKLLAFLRGEGKWWPTSVVAQHLKIPYGHVLRFRTKHNLHIKDISRAKRNPVFRKWLEDREANRVQNLKTMFSERPSIRHEELENFLRIFLEKNWRGLKWRLCIRCKKRWPKSKDFFRTTRRKYINGKFYYPLLTVCRACPSKNKNTSQNCPVFKRGL